MTPDAVRIHHVQRVHKPWGILLGDGGGELEEEEAGFEGIAVEKEPGLAFREPPSTESVDELGIEWREAHAFVIQSHGNRESHGNRASPVQWADRFRSFFYLIRDDVF